MNLPVGRMGPQVNRGFGVFLRDRPLGTPEESYLAFVAGDFMIDHANTDQFGFAWHDKGVPLTDFDGSMYVPMACTAVKERGDCTAKVAALSRSPITYPRGMPRSPRQRHARSKSSRSDARDATGDGVLRAGVRRLLERDSRDRN